MAKPGYETERERKIMLEKAGWFVMRISGSIGAADLIAVKILNTSDILAFSIRLEQVKKCGSNSFYFGEQANSEWARLYDIFEKYKIPCYFVVRFKIKNRAKFFVYKIENKTPPKKLVPSEEALKNDIL